MDLSGRSFKMEPLASVRSLERFVLRKAAKQWYDCSREELAFVRLIQSGVRVGLILWCWPLMTAADLLVHHRFR